MALPQEQYKQTYTLEEYYALPEGIRAEYIDGQIYYMSPAPNRIHQKLSSSFHFLIKNYINKKNGPCDVYYAPFDVSFTITDEETGDAKKYVFQPDISVICDPNKLTDAGCDGPPDWIIEITSPGNPSHDYITKLALYKAAGVREYWIVNPKTETVLVYFFESEIFVQNYTFKDKIKVNIYDDLYIDFNELNI